MAHITYPSAGIAHALRIAPSANAARKLLGMSGGALRKRCLRDPKLKPLFGRAVKRGKKLCGTRWADG